MLGEADGVVHVSEPSPDAPIPRCISPDAIAAKDRQSAAATVDISGSVRWISWLKKSFQVQMNVKIMVVARAGSISGRKILEKILK